MMRYSCINVSPPPSIQRCSIRDGNVGDHYRLLLPPCDGQRPSLVKTSQFKFVDPNNITCVEPPCLVGFLQIELLQIMVAKNIITEKPPLHPPCYENIF
mmetsp:Transcript_20973/g.35804  ORF Transcript_20973/g.35804 Transcript_20973/m.35804 type:complete len:99 (-) Transcript_20973:53-349(-)